MVYLPVQNIQSKVVLLTNHVCVVASEETTIYASHEEVICYD